MMSDRTVLMCDEHSYTSDAQDLNQTIQHLEFVIAFKRKNCAANGRHIQ